MIPLVDLKKQYATIKDDVDLAIREVLESGEYVLGRQVAAFEEEFASYCHSAYGIGVNSGTSALHIALLCSGIAPGDEVITTPFTFVATASAICYTGARPVFVDIDPRSFTIDPRAIEAAITPRTKALLPVHLYGQTADMDPILAIGAQHGLAVIEDAAQAHGAEYKGRRAGSMGDLGCFSFYPGKNLGAYGEGGMVVTNDAKRAGTARMLRDWGAERKYHHVLKGYNYRLEALQAAVLRVKLPRLESWIEDRQRVAASYGHLLADANIRLPAVMPYSRHVFHIYAIMTGERRDWQETLHTRGVMTGIHYPVPVHLLPAFRDLGYVAGQFPHSERAAGEVLSLPMFPELAAGDIEQIAEAIRSLARSSENRDSFAYE